MEHSAESAVKSQSEAPVDSKTVRATVERTVRRSRGTSSRGARRLTEIEKRVSKAMRRVTRALDRGVDTYIEHRDKSKETRKDGALVDFVENVSRGVSRTLAEASPLVHDVAEAMNTRRMRSQIRSVARTFRAIPFVG